MVLKFGLNSSGLGQFHQGVVVNIIMNFWPLEKYILTC